MWRFPWSGVIRQENLKTALATLEILRKSGAVKLDREALYEGLKRARQPGRFEVISGSGPAADGGAKAVRRAVLADRTPMTGENLWSS